MDADEPILIARFDSPFEAEEAKIALEEAGIESMIGDELVGDVGLPGGAGLGGVKLYVRLADANRAVTELAQTPAGKDLVVEFTDDEVPPEAGTQDC